jgi:hypothetical protein
MFFFFLAWFVIRSRNGEVSNAATSTATTTTTAETEPYDNLLNRAQVLYVYFVFKIISL